MNLIFRDALMAWIGTEGTWEKVGPMLAEVCAALKGKRIGVVGYCWGGKGAIMAISNLDTIMAAALVHPSRVTPEDCQKVRGPVLLLPSKDEPDMVRLRYASVRLIR